MIWLCALITCGTLGFFTWLSFVTGDPHWVQRGGALMAAFAAMLAVFEAFFERKAEVIKEEPVDVSILTPVGRMAARVKQARIRSSLGIISEQKVYGVLH